MITDAITKQTENQFMQQVFGVTNDVKILKEKKGRATVIEFDSNMYVLRHKDQMNRR